MIPTIICSSLSSFFTKENITFVLAAIGSVGTIISWLFYWATTRRHVEIEIFDYSSHWGRIAQLFIHFQNQSRSHSLISFNPGTSTRALVSRIIRPFSAVAPEGSPPIPMGFPSFVFQSSETHPMETLP